MIKRLLPMFFAALPLFAQSDAIDQPFRTLSLGDTLLSLPSSHIAGQGMWEVRFTHRFNQSLSDGSFSDQVHSLFGLDTNADVVIGLSAAMSRKLQFSFARSNTNDTLEGGAKYLVLQQTETAPLSLALRGGVDWRTERDLGDRTSFFAQAIVSHQFGRKAEVFIIPTIVTKAGRAVSGTATQSGALFDHAFNIPVAVAWMLAPGTSVVAELTPPNRDLPDDMHADPGWALGLKRQIGAHWFEILVTNNQSSLTDQFATTTFQGTPLDASEVHLGFNIERRFGRRR